jgi:hypothetical protein
MNGYHHSEDNNKQQEYLEVPVKPEDLQDQSSRTIELVASGSTGTIKRKRPDDSLPSPSSVSKPKEEQKSPVTIGGSKTFTIPPLQWVNIASDTHIGDSSGITLGGLRDSVDRLTKLAENQQKQFDTVIEMVHKLGNDVLSNKIATETTCRNWEYVETKVGNLNERFLINQNAIDDNNEIAVVNRKHISNLKERVERIEREQNIPLRQPTFWTKFATRNKDLFLDLILPTVYVSAAVFGICVGGNWIEKRCFRG